MPWRSRPRSSVTIFSSKHGSWRSDYRWRWGRSTARQRWATAQPCSANRPMRVSRPRYGMRYGSSPDPEEQRRQATELYRTLYARSPSIQYRQRLHELSPELQSDPPVLPPLPDIMLQMPAIPDVLLLLERHALDPAATSDRERHHNASSNGLVPDQSSSRSLYRRVVLESICASSQPQLRGRASGQFLGIQLEVLQRWCHH